MAIITEANLYDYLGLTANEPRLAYIAAGIDAAVKAKCGIDIEQTTYPASPVGGQGDSGDYCGTGGRFIWTRQTPVNCLMVTGDTVNGSTTVSNVPDVTRLFASQSIMGAGIPGGTTISSVGATSIVLSAAATATATGVSLTTGMAVWHDATGRFDVNPDGSFAAATLWVNGTDYALHTDGCLPGTSVKCSYEGRIESIGGYFAGVSVRSGGNLNRGVGNAPGNIKVKYTAGYPTIPGDLVLAALKMGAWIRATADTGGAKQSEKLGHYEYSLAQAAEAMTQVGGVMNMIGRYKRRLVAA